LELNKRKKKRRKRRKKKMRTMKTKNLLDRESILHLFSKGKVNVIH